MSSSPVALVEAQQLHGRRQGATREDFIIALRNRHGVCKLNMQSVPSSDSWRFCMAIIYTALQYRNLTETAGTPHDLGYISRGVVFDRRLGKQIDFTRFADDLVYDHLWLPGDSPLEFKSIEHFANAVDAAEMVRVRSNLGDLSRKPQTGIAMITALPSDREITLDEAQELAWQMVSAAQQNYRLPVHLAIHDPALKLPGSINRHAHAFIVRRELGPRGFASRKIRDEIALIRSGGGTSFVAEGIRWPDTNWEIQQTKLLELGTPLLVDLIAPYPQTHLTTAGSQKNTGRIALRRTLLKDNNLAAIHGNPATLLDTLLRGRRSAIEIEELRRFVARFIDAKRDRDASVDRILIDSDVVTLADTADPRKPRFITTAAIHSALAYAVDLVDRSKEGLATIHTAIGVGHTAVVAAIDGMLEENSIDFSNNGLLIIGSRLSHCTAMATSLESAKPELATIASVLAKGSAKGNKRTRRELPAGGLVIVPCAEGVGDQDLAALLDLAQQSETQLVLGKDLTQHTGVVANRLVCYAVERLINHRTISKQAVSAEQLLRAGLTTAAIRRMADQLTFASLDNPIANHESFDFVICTNGTAIKVADSVLAAAYQKQRIAEGTNGFTADLTRGPVEFLPGQSIVFTRTDYSELPPKVREGQIAAICSIDPRKSTLRVRLPDGTVVPIKTRSFPWFRSAFAISIREARYVKQPARFRIEIGDARHAWAALVLAATQGPTASVVIDPLVARNASSLAIVVSGSLPGALPPELKSQPDWNAEASTVMDAYALENMPEPTNSVPDQRLFIRRILVAEDVRALLASDTESARGFRLLCQRLHPENQYRETVVEKLRRSCHPDGLTAHLVRRILEAYGPTPEGANEGPDDDLDMPRELASSSPRQWEGTELWQLKVDLFAMTRRGSQLDIDSIGPGQDVHP
jgi:hypothetical protein